MLSNRPATGPQRTATSSWWRLRMLACILAIMLSGACQLAPPTITTRETAEALPTTIETTNNTPTPSFFATAQTAADAPPPGQATPTALIEMVLPTPTITQLPISIPPAQATELAGDNPNLALTALADRGGALQVDNVAFVSAERIGDNDQAIITLSVEFYGGNSPYTFLNDNRFVISGPPMGSFDRSGRLVHWMHMQLRGACGATMIHTVGVLSFDGQRVNHEYYIASTPCS